MLKHLAVAVSVVLLTLCTVAQTSGNPPTTTTFYPAKPLPGVVPPTQTMAMPAIGPLFIQTDQISSSLMLVNNAAVKAGATVSITDLDGRQIAQQHLILDPGSQQNISLSTLLANATEPATMGSISVLEDEGLQGDAVNAQLLITDYRNPTPGYIDEELAMPSMEGSTVLRGVTDSSEGPPLLAISNLENQQQTVTVRCLVQGSTETHAQVVIPALATSLTTACSNQPAQNVDSYLQSLPHPGHTAVWGVELTGNGAAGTLAAFAFAPHKRKNDIVFSAVPFQDPQLQRSSTTIYAGVPAGVQSLPLDGTFVPHISVANFSTNTASITIMTSDSQDRPLSNGKPAKDLPPQSHTVTLSLKAGESTELVLDSARSQVGLLHSIKVESDQAPGLVESKVVSRGDRNLYQVELLGKDAKGMENAGGHPWTTQGDNQASLLLFNPGTIATTFVVHIAAGAQGWEKKYVLAPLETRKLSINQIVLDQVPDDAGRVLKPDSNLGVVFWSTVDPGRGTGRLMVSSQAAVSARNFSCGYTYVVCGLYISVFYDGFIPLDEYAEYASLTPEYCLAWGYGACSNLTQTSSSGGVSYNWSLGNYNIVNFNSPSDQYSQSTNLKGVGIGATTSFASATENGCSASGGGSPGPSVAPTISSISPGQGLVGTAISVSINGAGFASGATVNAGTNITVSNESVVSTSQITATFTPSNSTSAGGNQGVTVTVAGQKSNSVNFFVQYPLHLYYVDTTETPNNGHSAITSGTDITIKYPDGTVPPNGTGVCGGYQWISYGVKDQNGNEIANGTATFAESFSNISPSPDPFGGPQIGSPESVNLATDYLADIYALWISPPPTCEPANDSDSFHQQWTAKVGTVTYPLATVISISRSTNSQGLPTFSSSITTP